MKSSAAVLALACLACVALAEAAEKAPAIPLPPLKAEIRHRDGEYGPTKWTWDSVASVQDPVTGETLYIGGRIGGLETGHPGHWALGTDGKTWRELKGASAVLDPLRKQALDARALAKLAEAKARCVFYDALDASKEAEAIKGEPAALAADASKKTDALASALNAAKAAGWESEGLARAKPLVAKAAAGLKAAQAGFAQGRVDAELLKHAFTAQWALDEAADALASSPGPREGACVGVDPEARCVVVFGGSHGDYALNDTWIYDCAAKSWRQVWPATAPSARFTAPLAWNAEKKALTLSGGQTILNKMVYQKGEMPAPAGEWSFVVKENAWKGEGGTAPGTRIYRTIVPAYDPCVFDAAPRGDRRATDAWLAKLPANTWTVVPNPPAMAAERDWGTSVFDPDRDRIYFWTGGHCADPSNGMSTYHPGINRWSLSYVPEIMLARKGMSFNGRPDCANHTYLHYNYDPVSKRLICTAEGGTGIYNPDTGDFEANIPHPFNRQVYETCSVGTPKGFVVWGRGYFGVLDVKARAWSKLPVKGKLPGPTCDGSAFAYDSKRDVLWLTTFLGYQKPSGNIWMYDMKSGEAKAMDPANAESIGKAKGFNNTIRESVYLPEADIVLYNNVINGKNVAYDCAKNRWVLTNIQGKYERQGGHSDTLRYDAKRGIVWNLNAYKSIIALKIDAKTLVLSEQP
ncbi:MAG: hypothetical protein KIS92_23755 [Planctomycetota bacterium]|nr:hypothetical protein [Planctomycetota bacterium]